MSGGLPPPDHAYDSTQITHQGVIRDGHRGNQVADYIGGYARARSLVSAHSPCSGCSPGPAGAPPSPAAGSSYSEVADAWQIMPQLTRSGGAWHRDRRRTTAAFPVVL